MKRLALLVAIASVVLFAFVVPASAATITQTPNTAGMVYTAGTPLTISWTSEGLMPDSRLTLVLATPQAGGTLKGESLVWELPQSGSYTIDVPASSGWYFYYLECYEPVPGGQMLTRSNAYEDFDDGHGWWFSVGTLAPSITQLPAIGGKTYAEGQELEISWTSKDLQPDARLTLIEEYNEPDGNADGWPIATDLPQSGSYTVTMPVAIEGTKWSFSLLASWNDGSGGVVEVYSDQFGKFFDVVQAQPVTVSAPWLSAVPRAKKTVGFEATVTPAAAASKLYFTVRLSHLEYVGTGKRKVATWVSYPPVILSSGGVLPGGIAGGGALPARGEWKMYVSWAAANGYAGGQSPETTFTVK